MKPTRALRRLQSAPPNTQQRFLLAECVQAYLPLDDDHQREFERTMASDTYRGVQAMNKTWFEKGQEQGIALGIEKGIEKERRESVRDLLEERFGTLMPTVLKRLDEVPADRLQALQKALLKAGSIRDLGLEE